MKYKLFLTVIGLVIYNCCAATNTVNTSAPAIPQVAPNVVITPSNQDLKEINKLFSEADYNHLQINMQSDTQTFDKLFEIPDLANISINDLGGEVSK